ncbi:hypothetical protein MKW98_013572 [Papaver atlanticum]|uniref:Uncharacterized protein n=1 Tax=Papaver atlanticum TaxID=357466 RepID=A0AAD4T362_9MAGN|nr:hypothetical protein MKW98_013572 [Papaver atlanticum]
MLSFWSKPWRRKPAAEYFELSHINDDQKQIGVDSLKHPAGRHLVNTMDPFWVVDMLSKRDNCKLDVKKQYIIEPVNRTIPRDDRCMFDKESLPEIWALEFSNPWCCSFDSQKPPYFLCVDPGKVARIFGVVQNVKVIYITIHTSLDLDPAYILKMGHPKGSQNQITRCTCITVSKVMN